MYHNMTTLLTTPLSSFGPTPTFPYVPEVSNLMLIVLIVAIIGSLVAKRVLRSKGVYNVILRALRYRGAIPEHVAFIMDGNRRWARRFGLPASSGHPQGGEKLIESLQWCLEVGIQTVTVFAFSIENFKRSPDEVCELMALAEHTFRRFASKQNIIHERRVRVRVLGDLRFVPKNLRKVFANVMNETSGYIDGPTLNICFSYASRYDMANAVRDIIQLCDDGSLQADDIDEDVVAACLASGFAKGASTGRYPDLLVRTSGETRLSDFLLWEAANSVLSFCPVLWPEFSVWDFVKILLSYQRTVSALKIYHFRLTDSQPYHYCSHEAKSNERYKNRKIHESLVNLRQKYFDELHRMSENREIYSGK